jgi:hypothetical protein
MGNFIFGKDALESDYSFGGYHWHVNWMGGKVNARIIEAARLAIDTANNRAAQNARDDHEWSSDTGQTESSVFVKRAELVRVAGRPRMFGAWGVHDIDRTPLRIAGETYHTNYPQYEGKTLTTKDVALLLEFGFHTRAGQYRQYPWLYPAWDKEKGTVLPLMKTYYDILGPRYRYMIPGRFLSTEQVWGFDPNLLL